MADATLNQPTAPVAPLRAELQIQIYPRQYTEFLGTAAQLIEAGFIPPEFEWPSERRRSSYELGEFSYWLGRRRPDGLKGPMKSWTSGDFWFLRRHPTSKGPGSYLEVERHLLQAKLTTAIFMDTAAGREQHERAYRARTDKRYMAFRSQVLSEML